MEPPCSILSISVEGEKTFIFSSGGRSHCRLDDVLHRYQRRTRGLNRDDVPVVATDLQVDMWASFFTSCCAVTLAVVV